MCEFNFVQLNIPSSFPIQLDSFINSVISWRRSDVSKNYLSAIRYFFTGRLFLLHTFGSTRKWLYMVFIFSFLFSPCCDRNVLTFRTRIGRKRLWPLRLSLIYREDASFSILKSALSIICHQRFSITCTGFVNWSLTTDESSLLLQICYYSFFPLDFNFIRISIFSRAWAMTLQDFDVSAWSISIERLSMDFSIYLELPTQMDE